MFNQISPWFWIKLAWVQAVIGMLGSLYASEVLGLVPCVLCWYQRIALYPLVVILGMAAWRKDKLVQWYAWPLVLVGAGFAFYHTLLQWKLIPEGLTTCVGGVSCSSVLFSWFGFINFPFLSLLAFGSIGVCLFLAQTKATRVK